MEDYKRCDLEATNSTLSQIDFTYIMKVEPANDSFYLSFGISLIETIIRTRNSDYTKPTISKINSIWENISIISPYVDSNELSEVIIMFNLVKNYVLDDDVSQLDALSWFRDIMSTNQNCIAYALAMSMRFILGYILEAQNKVDQTEAIGRDKEEFDLTTKSYYIKDFCRYLQIAIILNSKHTEPYYNKNTETVPAVYLYCAQNEWSVLFHSKILAFGVDTDVGAFPYLYCHATDAISLRTLKESEEDSWKSENPKDAVIEYLARIILENHLDIHDYKHSIEPIRELINRKGSSKYLHLNSILNCKMKTNEESLQSTLETAPSTTNLYKCVKCGQELTEYDLEVKCQGHDVCVGCRFDNSTSSCLVCNRAYSDREQIHLKNY